MKAASECRMHAAECRSMAKSMSDQQRRQALEMAEMWDRLAQDRERETPVANPGGEPRPR
jgi:hypothetical protein